MNMCSGKNEYQSRSKMESDPKCLFCSDKMEPIIIARHGSVYAIEDKSPVTPGHALVIPYRHTKDVFTMTEEEHRDADTLLGLLRDRLCREDPSITGFNVGANCGESAGQTIMHAHIHLIPRRDGDTSSPRGGVRGVVPDKMGY